jgi:hypothetical protein
MVNSGTKAAPKAFKLNPNAPSFVPVAKKIPVEWLNVEEFSPLWYALMNASAEYQQYWEKTCFQDEEDLFAGDMQALHDLDALVESEQAKQQVVGNKASTRSSTGAGNKIRSGDALTITGSVDALGVLSLSNDISKIHLSESTNAGDRQEVEPVNASADTRVFSPSPELVNSLQRLEELQDAVNGKEVSPVNLLTDIGCGLQTLEWTSNSKDNPQQQVADSKVAHDENEVDPVHSDTQTGGDIHSLELTSSSEDTPQQHLTESTDQSDTVATTAYRSS